MGGGEGGWKRRSTSHRVRSERKIKIRRKVTTLYLLENEGFHSGKDEGNITKAAHGHSSNSARHWGVGRGRGDGTSLPVTNTSLLTHRPTPLPVFDATLRFTRKPTPN